MKKFWEILILLIFAAGALNAQNRFFRHGITVNDDQGNFFDKLEFGVSEEATVGIDTALGEFEIPGHPPGGTHGFFVVEITPDSGFISYVDMRPAPGEEFYVEHEIDLMIDNRSDSYDLRWDKLPSIIDSALIESVFGYDIFHVDMKQEIFVTVDNVALDDLILRVWYDFNPATSVREEIADESQISVYPNPANEYIVIKSDFSMYQYKLISLEGEIVTSGYSFTNEIRIDTGNLPSGEYFIIAEDNYGNIERGRFIR